jgi:BirA family transcriptional regulator, biotin operon repressor / biotin---[acetyl-CoA-carboxylase] ligase
MSDLGDLSHVRVLQLLNTTRYGRSLEIVARTGSTNDDARQRAAAGAADGHTIVADTQNAGRGSRGRQWSSPPGQDLYVSIVARVPVALAQLPPLTLAVGLAVAEAVDATLGDDGRGHSSGRARVKWPNDVWIDERKVAGILIEGASTGHHLESVVIGIGLNVNRRAFPEGLDTPATSLQLAAKAGNPELNRSDVLATLLLAVERWVDRFVAHGVDPIVNALDQRLALRGERVRCDERIGTLAGVARSGALRLRTENGFEDVFSGRIERVS